MPEISGENRDEQGKFVKGVSGNPEGRPKGSVSVVSAIKKKLEECPEGKQKTYLHYLVEKIMKKAVVDDDVAMIKDIIDRVDGKATNRTEVTGKDGGAIQIQGNTIEIKKYGDSSKTGG